MSRIVRCRGGVFSALFVAGALLVYIHGWKLLWFLTDDAYIAFRYVSNRQLGHGYVWNAPPFLPVEGYTNFLWIVLLDAVWSWLGVEPPESSNWLGFAFGLGTLGATAFMAHRLRLCDALRPFRPWIVLVVVFGLVTNFSFLMWTSSGLETSLFNFLFAAWVASVLYLEGRSTAWMAIVSLCAGLLALTRPDGMLMIAASAVLFATVMLSRRRLPRLDELLGAAPLAIPVVHTLWRRAYYGEWLPNTYYAKHVEAWPEAGLRYLLSYVLEYGLWFWALLVVVAVWMSRRSRARAWEATSLLRVDPSSLSVLCVVATTVAHVGYYILAIGGDHFEYRVLSHTVPLILLSAVWAANRLAVGGHIGRPLALVLPTVVVALSWPIPWMVWKRSQQADARTTSFNLVVRVADAFPPGTRWYAARFDDLQEWLIRGHAIGKRYQEHRVFHLYRIASLPRERKLSEDWHTEHRVHAARTVGVVGWILARADVIDLFGLNDWVTARNPKRRRSRRMAHDRVPPPGYVECFEPNVGEPLSFNVHNLAIPDLLRYESREFEIVERPEPMTSSRIEACEQYWRASIGAGLRSEPGQSLDKSLESGLEP
ncbi:MAG TPA: hypothetical protein VLK65_14555 [Vicinamibacteria bacterium]|nr:hypothetical protein [Vicinamibacteria bacterium]